MESFKIKKIRGHSSEISEDYLVEEVPLTIISGDKELATFLCTPLDIEDLVRGFLFTSGLISKLDDIKKISIDRKRWTAYVELSDETIIKDMIFKRVYTSGCGSGTFFYNAFDLLKNLVKNNPKEYMLVGGGTKSSLWCQIVCDVLVILITFQWKHNIPDRACL